jgi:peptidoglycan/LPS O-acetylase OafA/YrhL
MPRLAGVLAGLIAGAVGGGLLFLHARSYAPVLPLAITVLAIVAGRGLARRTSAEVDSHGVSTVGNRSWTRRYTRGVSKVKTHSHESHSEDLRP